MLALHVTVPIACFRKGLMREFLETEVLPPPSTCYGFLLALVGETDRRVHLGCRVTAGLLQQSDVSTILRNVWRIKDRSVKDKRSGEKTPQYPGQGNNRSLDYQQLLTDVRLVVWLDSSEEQGGGSRLEDRVRMALSEPERIDRFGGLSLGESTHLVNDVSLLVPERVDRHTAETYLLADRGRLTLPVWVDHVGSAGTRYAVGDLEESPFTEPPPVDRLPQILAPQQ